MLTPDDRRVLLVRGLVGDEYADLYRTSPMFHMTIDQLAQTLPLWVDGLASAAAEEDQRMAAKRAELLSMSWPLPPVGGL